MNSNILVTMAHASYNDLLERALQLAQVRHPEASPQNHAAFANAVAERWTHTSGGYGGPRSREHAAVRWQRDQQFASLEALMESLLALDAPCFCPLVDENGEWIETDATKLIYWAWNNEHCFDDTPEDEAALESHRADLGDERSPWLSLDDVSFESVEIVGPDGTVMDMKTFLQHFAEEGGEDEPLSPEEVN